MTDQVNSAGTRGLKISASSLSRRPELNKYASRLQKLDVNNDGSLDLDEGTCETTPTKLWP